MKIALVMTLYNEHYLLENTLDSILGSSKYDCDVHINLSGPRFVEKNIECLQAIIEKDKNYKLYPFICGEEICNHPIFTQEELVHRCYYELGYDVVVTGSPDYVFKEKDGFDVFMDKSLDYIDNKYMISCVSHEGSNVKFAFQIVTKKRLEEVGYIDKNFVPMGSSDVDLHRRCLLINNPGQDLEYYNSPENFFNSPYGVNIVIPSDHLSYSEYGTLGIDCTNYFFKNSFDYFNKKYYYEKWGGRPGAGPNDPGTEKYVFPFNDSEISIKISYEQRKSGYSKYDRGYLTLGSMI